MEYMLIDFEFATITENPDKEMPILAKHGTLHYMSPECNNYLISPKSDVWSLGVTVYCSMVGHEPYSYAEDRPYGYPVWNRIRNISMRKLLKDMLTPDSRDRPTMKEVVERAKKIEIVK